MAAAAAAGMTTVHALPSYLCCLLRTLTLLFDLQGAHSLLRPSTQLWFLLLDARQRHIAAAQQRSCR